MNEILDLKYSELYRITDTNRKIYYFVSEEHLNNSSELVLTESMKARYYIINKITLTHI